MFRKRIVKTYTSSMLLPVFTSPTVFARILFALEANARKSPISNRSHAEAGDPDAAAEVTAFFLRPEASWSAASKRVAQHSVVERVRKRQ